MLKVMENIALLSWFQYLSSRWGASVCSTHSDCILRVSVVCSTATNYRPSINVKYRAHCQFNLIHVLDDIFSKILCTLCGNQPSRLSDYHSCFVFDGSWFWFFSRKSDIAPYIFMVFSIMLWKILSSPQLSMTLSSLWVPFDYLQNRWSEVWTRWSTLKKENISRSTILYNLWILVHPGKEI
jgi:hypothetical protein